MLSNGPALQCECGDGAIGTTTSTALAPCPAHGNFPARREACIRAETAGVSCFVRPGSHQASCVPDDVLTVCAKKDLHSAGDDARRGQVHGEIAVDETLRKCARSGSGLRMTPGQEVASATAAGICSSDQVILRGICSAMSVP